MVNIYVSDELKQKWINYEFIGKPYQCSDGKHYIRAISKAFDCTHFYCFEDDWFWHDRPIINPVATSSKV